MSPLKIVAALLALVAVVAANPDHGAPAAHGHAPAANGHAPAAHGHAPAAHGHAPAAHHPTYGVPPPTYGYPEPETKKPKYDFHWEVKDEYSGNDFGHDEARDGYNTEGSYHILLPDGRVQTTTYTVHKDGGFVANVVIEGEIKHEKEGYGHAHPPPKTYAPPTTHAPAYGHYDAHGHA